MNTNTSPFPRVDKHMNDDDLTAAAERIHSAVDWRWLPKLAEIFMHRPRVNRYWHELVGLVLQYLEHDAGPASLRHASVIEASERVAAAPIGSDASEVAIRELRRALEVK